MKVDYGKVRINLSRLAKDADEFVVPALMIGAEPILEDAQRRTHVITGNLRRSESIQPGPGKFEVNIGTDVEYAPFEEFGTRYRPPHPFLRPAFDTYITAAQQRAAKAFWALVEKRIA